MTTERPAVLQELPGGTAGVQPRSCGVLPYPQDGFDPRGPAAAGVQTEGDGAADAVARLPLSDHVLLDVNLGRDAVQGVVFDCVLAYPKCRDHREPSGALLRRV